MVPMAPSANPLDDPADAAALAGHAAALVEAVVGALPGWVRRVVRERYVAARGGEIPSEVAEAAREAGEKVVHEVEGPLRSLLAQDVDDQRANPLAIVRRAVPLVTAVLRDAGVPPPERDAHAERLFPEDVYDLVPASFGDLDASVQEPGLVWGAAKAHVVLRRRRAEGR